MISTGQVVAIQQKCRLPLYYLAPHWRLGADDDRLNQEITAFYNHMSPTRPEFEVRFFVIEMITRAIHSIWPNADVTPFGSWQTQLYLPQGYVAAL